MIFRTAWAASTLSLLLTTSARSQNPTPQIPLSFVKNCGQLPSEVRYIAASDRVHAWFDDRGLSYQLLSRTARLDFVNANPSPVMESEAPLGAAANYLRGNDPARWQQNVPMYRSVIYRQVWPGIDVRFYDDQSELNIEFDLQPGASADVAAIRLGGAVRLIRDERLLPFGTPARVTVVLPESGQTQRARFYRRADGTFGVALDQLGPSPPAIVYSGFLGGGSQSSATGVVTDSTYSNVVVGWTTSIDLPATNGVRGSYSGGVDAFVCSFGPAGGALKFCTYLGGAADDRAFGVAVDASNNIIYVTGWTSSANFPLVGAAQNRLSGTRDAFVAKLNSTGTSLIFSTYFGGKGVDAAYGIALDSTNAAVIVGDTTSSNLSAVGTFQARLAGGQDAFVARFAPSGNSVTAVTYLGGAGQDHSAAIKVDASNNIFIGGSTYSANFPCINAFQSSSGGGQDGFIAKLSSDLKTMIFGSYLGGSNGGPGMPEQVNALALEVSGGLIVVGTTSSTDFPVTNDALQSVFGGGNSDGFLTLLSAATGDLVNSTVYGGSSDDGITGVAADFFGNIYITGFTLSTDFPVRNAIQPASGGGMDAFVAKLKGLKIIYSTYLGGQGNDSANGLALDSFTSVVIAGSSGSSKFPVMGSVGAWQGAAQSAFLTKLAPPFRTALVSEPNWLIDQWRDSGLSGSTVTLKIANFGQSGDLPIAGDWDGSGVKRIGVFRNGSWLLDMNGNGVFDSGDKTVLFGQAGDVPVVGDWTGTGKIKLGLFRAGTFILDLSGHLSGIATGLSDALFPFGLPGDLPVANDWNGSGTTKVGVFRNGQWLVDYNGDRVFNGLDQTYAFGQAGDLPIIGDWDGSGVLKIGVYRSGLWILDYGGYNRMLLKAQYELYIGFGAAGYIPLIM